MVVKSRSKEWRKGKCRFKKRKWKVRI